MDLGWLPTLDVAPLPALIAGALAGLVLVYLKSPAVIGRAGERRVRSALRRHLDPDRYRVLHNLTLPANGGTTQIDHLVASPFGIFVIETKNMSGWIFGGREQRKWTQVVGRRKIPFQNPLHQNHKHIRVVAEMTGLDPGRIFGIVVFVGSARPKTAMPENVAWSARALTRAIRSRREVVLTDPEVSRLTETLAAGRLVESRATDRRHVAHLKERQALREDPSRCPRCGESLMLRVHRRNGERFLGCTRYPQCKGTRPVGDARHPDPAAAQGTGVVPLSPPRTIP